MRVKRGYKKQKNTKSDDKVQEKKTNPENKEQRKKEERK